MFSSKTIALLLAVFVIGCLVLVTVFAKKDAESVGPLCFDELDVCEYVGSFGIEVDAERSVKDRVLVPQVFNDVYDNYNKIQLSQGFDLRKYKGKSLDRFTLPVLNYPDNSQEVYVEVLICDDIIVAADIYSVSLNGFIKALK